MALMVSLGLMTNVAHGLIRAYGQCDLMTKFNTTASIWYTGYALISVSSYVRHLFLPRWTKLLSISCPFYTVRPIVAAIVVVVVVVNAVVLAFVIVVIFYVFVLVVVVLVVALGLFYVVMLLH